jgi:hypothetical protein
MRFIIRAKKGNSTKENATRNDAIEELKVAWQKHGSGTIVIDATAVTYEDDSQVHKEFKIGVEGFVADGGDEHYELVKSPPRRKV